MSFVNFHFTLRSNDPVSDAILFNIAESVSDEMKITRLGIALGVPLPDINRHLAANTRDGHVTYKGTLNLLCDWKERITGNDQERKLRTALKDSGLAEIADKIFGEGWLLL